MGLFHKIMNKLGRYRLIPDRKTGADYMHRYYLFLKNRKTFPLNFTLHKIVKSDDPIMHDHPWSFMTIVLKGGDCDDLSVAFCSLLESVGIQTALVDYQGNGDVRQVRKSIVVWCPKRGPTDCCDEI